MSLSWIEAIFALNKDIVACERRFHQQCILVAQLAASKQVTSEEELLLASYMTSLKLLRAHRNSLLADAPTDA